MINVLLNQSNLNRPELECVYVHKCNTCNKVKDESKMSRFTGENKLCGVCATKNYTKKTGYKKKNKPKIGIFTCKNCRLSLDGKKMKTYSKCESCYRKELYLKNPESLKNRRTWHQKRKYPHLRKKAHSIRSKRLKNASRCLSKEQKNLVQNFYLNCPIGYDVDHIIPLNHVNVCGLNTLANLQYLDKKINSAKKNKWDGTYNNKNWKNK